MNVRTRSHLLIIGCILLWFIGFFLPEAQIYYQAIDTTQTDSTAPQTTRIAFSRNVIDFNKESTMPCPYSVVEWMPNTLLYGFFLWQMFTWLILFLAGKCTLLYAQKIGLGIWKFFVIVVISFAILLGVALLANNFSWQSSNLICDSHYLYRIFGFIPYGPALFVWIAALFFGFAAVYSVSDPAERQIKHILSRLWW